jgi:hypothetical protein
MIRIVERRQDAVPGEEVFELRVFQLHDGDVRACVVPADLPMNHHMMDEMSEPARLPSHPVLRLPENTVGRDLIIGDVFHASAHDVSLSQFADGIALVGKVCRSFEQMSCR